MIVAVLADEDLKKEWLSKDAGADVELIWADSLRALMMTDADAYFDLLFEMDSERTGRLKQLLPKPVFVNAVAYTTKIIGHDFIRVNAWPGFLQRNLTEIALAASVPEKNVASVFEALNWQYRVVPDICGLITARIVAMIINEAFYTWGSEVSSKEEIDTAMKLGTNYPMGPFEWSEKIGLQKIHELLKELGRTDERYTIAPALISTINEQVSNP